MIHVAQYQNKLAADNSLQNLLMAALMIQNAPSSHLQERSPVRPGAVLAKSVTSG